MTDEHERQLEQFGKAVDEKKRRSKIASEAASPGEGQPSAKDIQGDQEDLYSRDRPQDAASPRAKSSGKGKKTADKWNQ